MSLRVKDLLRRRQYLETEVALGSDAGGSGVLTIEATDILIPADSDFETFIHSLGTMDYAYAKLLAYGFYLDLEEGLPAEISAGYYMEVGLSWLADPADPNSGVQFLTIGNDGGPVRSAKKAEVPGTTQGNDPIGFEGEVTVALVLSGSSGNPPDDIHVARAVSMLSQGT